MSILTDISENLQRGKAKVVKELVQQAVDEGIPVEQILSEGLLDGMGIIGEKFKNNEVFVPEVLVAARAMNMGTQVLKPLLAREVFGSVEWIRMDRGTLGQEEAVAAMEARLPRRLWEYARRLVLGWWLDGPLMPVEGMAALLEELDRAYAALLAGDLSAYLAAYRSRCVNLGKTVRLLPFGGGEPETAQAVDIDGEFGLVVRGADGKERTVRSGEVSVRGLWGYTE